MCSVSISLEYFKDKLPSYNHMNCDLSSNKKMFEKAKLFQNLKLIYRRNKTKIIGSVKVALFCETFSTTDELRKSPENANLSNTLY